MSIVEQYTQEMHDRFGYLATWLPNTRLALGDVGILRRDNFERVTTLKELGVAFQAGPSGASVDFDYCSSGAIEFESDLSSGDDIAKSNGKAALRVKFGRARAVLFVASGCKTTQIADPFQLGLALARLRSISAWRSDYVVVTGVITTGRATIIISDSDQASIDFAVPATAASYLTTLASAEAELHVLRSRGIATRFIAKEKLTPLFQASGFKRRLLGRERFTKRSSSHHDSDLEFGDLSYSDVEDDWTHRASAR